jgi:hypothetical protein
LPASQSPAPTAGTDAPEDAAGEPETPVEQGREEAASAAVAPQVVPAVWREHELAFAYMGRTSHYSCSGLRSMITKVLEQMGARPGFTVKMGSCFNSMRTAPSMPAVLGESVPTMFSGVQTMPTVRLNVAFPVEATPQALEDMQERAPERELVRRAQGLPTDFDPALDQFAAVYTTVVLEDGAHGPIDPGDCELIETLRDQVFEKVGMQILEDRLACTPGEARMGNIGMKVRILEQPRPLEAPKKGEKAPEGSGQEPREVELPKDPFEAP